MLIMKDGEICSPALWDMFCTLLNARIEEYGCSCHPENRARGEMELQRSLEVMAALSVEGIPINMAVSLVRFKANSAFCDQEVLTNVGPWYWKSGKIDYTDSELWPRKKAA